MLCLSISLSVSESCFLQPVVWSSAWWGRSRAVSHLYIYLSLYLFSWLSALSSGLAAGGCSGGWRNYLYFLLPTPASASVAPSPSPGNRAADSAPVETSRVSSRAEELSKVGREDDCLVALTMKAISHLFLRSLAFPEVFESHRGTLDVSLGRNPEIFSTSRLFFQRWMRFFFYAWEAKLASR